MIAYPAAGVARSLQDPGARLGRGSPAEGVLRALALVTSVWTLLLLPALSPGALRSGATLLAYAAALVWVLATRPNPRVRLRARGWSLAALGVVAGLLSYPAWISFSIAVGFALGLPGGSAIPAGAGSPSAWTVPAGM